MKLKTQTPKKILNKAFLKQRPLRSEIEDFKLNLKTLFARVEARESEENKKNHVRDFLLDTYYKGRNEVNTKDRKDLVIHLDRTNKSKVGVIIEAKTPVSADMVRLDKLNTKAFHELVLYYFDERKTKDNSELKNLAITNIYEWFIFDANVFDKQIYRNTKIKKHYETYKNDKKDNPFFYEELRKLIENLDEEITCTYFNLKDYETVLNNVDLEDDKKLIELYKILSPYHLLKEPFAEDSNALNKPFYDELLHIIGLEEVKKKSKSIIRRKEVGNRYQGSLIENAITILKTKDSLHKVENIADYWGELSDEQKFAFDDSGMFANNTIFFMTGKHLKYLLSVLNSNLSKWYFNAISTSSGMGTNRWLKYKIEQLPIKQITPEKQKPFIKLVDEILEKKKLGQETEDLENEIDRMVYRLYDLTDEEIAIVGRRKCRSPHEVRETQKGQSLRLP